MGTEFTSVGYRKAGRSTGGLSGLLGNIAIGRKLIIMAAALGIPTLVLLAMYINGKREDIAVTQAEIGGMEWFQPLEEMTGRISDHSAITVTGILKGTVDKSASTAYLSEIDKWISEMDKLDAKYGTPAHNVAWKAIRAEWQTIKNTEYRSTEESLAAHSRLLNNIKDLKDRINVDTGMILDPEAASYFAIDLAVNRVPNIERLVGENRALLAAVAARGKATDGEKLQFVEFAAVAARDIQDMTSALQEVRKASSGDPKAAALAAALPAGWEPKISKWLHDSEAAVMGAATPETLRTLIQQGDEIPELLGHVHDGLCDLANGLLDTRLSHDRTSMWTMLSIIGAVLLFALSLVTLVIRRISSTVTDLSNTAGRISQGHYDNDIDDQGGDELADLSSSMRRMQDQLHEDELGRAAAAVQISQMRGGLDAASANVMVADGNNNIVYMNASAVRLFADLEPDLRKELPQFNSRELIGKNVDVFHKNPSHQQRLLSQLSKTHHAQFFVGGRTVHFTANPIVGAQGERVGTVVEWTDRTQEVAAEKDVLSVVEAFVAGDLKRRIPEEDKTGFYAVMAKNLNQIVGNVADVVEDVRVLVESARAGDLAKRMHFEGKPGLAEVLGNGVNMLVDEVANVVGEVNRLVEAANGGDLTQRIPIEGKGGLFQKVGGGVNALTSNMASVISQVKDAASEVHRGADEISQGNTNLSQRTEEQASSLEETASSMEEMTSTVKQNADNAGQANQLAVAARDQAEKGGAVVAKAVRAMSEINDSSKRIADIIGVIDEIAFQTNLLALNAAVEAARAGEQGRGFAVVATEVRNLAGRSATAAKEIKGLIQDSVKKVDEGSLLVTQSGATLDQIVSAVKKVTDIVAEIAAASQEQSAGIEQVNKAVMQLDELTQQNAALVEEASAASQSMADQARGLNETMARYRVDEGGSRTTVRSAPMAVPRPVARPAAAPAPRSRVASTGTDDAVWKEF